MGVILYQQGFFISKANHDATMEIFGRAPYPTGGFQIGWENDVAGAYP